MLVVFVIQFSNLYAIDPLRITQRALVYGSACDTHIESDDDQFARPGLLAGSSMLLIIRNDYDQSLEPLDTEWPDGYSLDFAIDCTDRESFNPDRNVFDQLRVSYVISLLNLTLDQMQKQGAGHVDLTQRNSKQFVVYIPTEFAGHSLSYRVRYDGNGVVKESAVSPPLEISSPCNEYDQARIISSEVFVSFKISNYEHAIDLADSMINSRLSDPGGFYYAYKSALFAYRYDKAMVYFDKLWTDYGILSLTSGSSSPVAYNPNGERSDEEAQIFRATIDNLRALQAEQEQQDE